MRSLVKSSFVTLLFASVVYLGCGGKSSTGGTGAGGAAGTGGVTQCMDTATMTTTTCQPGTYCQTNSVVMTASCQPGCTSDANCETGHSCQNVNMGAGGGSGSGLPGTSKTGVGVCSATADLSSSASAGSVGAGPVGSVGAATGSAGTASGAPPTCAQICAQITSMGCMGPPDCTATCLASAGCFSCLASSVPVCGSIGLQQACGGFCTAGGGGTGGGI